MTTQSSRLATALAGRYRLERELGQGGMATVYLAFDEKHDRQVAIKVLKPELAAVLGAERFVVEIKTTAAMSHPHILPLFDSGEADGFLYYVMPYIEGETIREKLTRETQFGIDEAVRITREIADALDYAHRRGIIHRDIKPENILLHDGRAMVMDFGIALAVSAAAGGRMTETGLSLGTPHYMSPEQATAEKEISRRSDVYSLASVLYEMLAGQPPHLGGSAQQIIMKIIAEPSEPVTRYRKSVPPNVAAAIAKALEKLPADRFESAKLFGDALVNPQFSHATAGADPAKRLRDDNRSRTRRSSLLGWGIGAVGIGVSAWSLLTMSSASDKTVVPKHLNIVLPDSAPLTFRYPSDITPGLPALALSPDGRTLVYVALEGDHTRLHRRDIEGFEATPISGTEGAYGPVISPDGAWVAFFVGSELRKTPITGGTALPLTAVPETSGMDWSADGRILITAREGTELAWVPQAGGVPQRIAMPKWAMAGLPHILPGGRHALIETSTSGIYSLLGAVDLASGRVVAITPAGPVTIDSVDTRTVIPGQQPRYLASGHLVFTTPTGLKAMAFDPATLEVTGEAVEVLSGVRSVWGGTQYVVSVDGTLVYAPGSDADRGALVWVARDGSVDSLGFAPQRFGTFDLSPDGKRVVTLVSSVNSALELWVYDLERMTQNKVATRGIPVVPRWWLDGRHVMFTELSPEAAKPQVVVRQLVESTGARDTLARGWQMNGLGRDTMTAVGARGFGGGIWSVPLKASQEPVVIDSFPTAWGPTMSPDGRWIAYTSNEASQYEVYVTEAGRGGARRKVSLAGGEEPVWSPLGDALFYRWGERWFSVSVPKGGDATFGRPAMLFRGPYVNVFGRSHDVSPDGKRHLVVLGPTEQSTGHLNVITNWTELVTRRLGR